MSLSISLTTEQVEQRLSGLGISCRFTAEECAVFQTTPVVTSPEPLFGFPTPADNSQLTLSNIKNCVGTNPSKQPSFFEHPWFSDEPFMRNTCAPGWHFIYRDVAMDSIGQSIDYARRLNAAGLELPSAIEMVLMLFLHYEGTREQLLLRKHSWCSDSASLARHVTVGAFGRNGLFLSAHPAGFASRGLGICAKFRL